MKKEYEDKKAEEKAKIKERDRHRTKSVHVSKNVNLNLNNRIFDKRRNSNHAKDKDEFMNHIFNPIRIKVRKQSLA